MALIARISDDLEWNAVLDSAAQLGFGPHELTTKLSDDGRRALVLENSPEDRRRKLLVDRLFASPLKWELTLSTAGNEASQLWNCIVVRPRGTARWTTELVAFLLQQDFANFLSGNSATEVFDQVTTGELVITPAGEPPRQWSGSVVYQSQDGSEGQVLCRRVALCSPDGVFRLPPTVNHAHSSSEYRAALVAFRSIEDERSMAHAFGMIDLRTPVFSEEPQGLRQLIRPKSIFLM